MRDEMLFVVRVAFSKMDKTVLLAALSGEV